MKLETEQFFLREVKLTDVDKIYAMQNNDEYRQFFPWDIRSEAYIKKLIDLFLLWQKENPRSNYQFVIELKTNYQFVGTGGVHQTDLTNRSAEIGIRLSPEYWGKNYAYEISRALLKFGFHDLNLHRLTAEIIADNLPAAELCNRLQMKYEGRFKEHKWRNEKWYDSLRFAILDHEWRKLNHEN